MTASGEHVYIGEVANNQYPFGTELRFSRPVFGLTRFKVEDRIGWGSELDIYYPSESTCLQFGREPVTYQVRLPARR